MASNKVVLGSNFNALRSSVKSLGGDFDRAGQQARGAFGQMDQGLVSVSRKALDAAASVLAIGAAYGTVAVQAAEAFGEIDLLTRRQVALTDQLTQAAVDSAHRVQTELSIMYSISSSDVARGYYQAISAGARPENRRSLLETALQFQGVSGVDAGTGSQYLQQIANVFGYNPRRVGDVTRATEQAAVTTIPELVAGQGRFIPQAAELGLGLEESLSLYGAGTLQGLTPRYAASGTGALLRELINPNSLLAKAIGEQFGKSAKELIADGKTVIRILMDLRKALGGEDFAGALTSESMRIALPLTGAAGAASYRQVAGRIEAGAGSLQAAWDFISESPKVRLEQAKQVWQNAWEDFGAQMAPAALNLADMFSDDLMPVLVQTGNIVSSLSGGFNTLLGALSAVLNLLELADQVSVGGVSAFDVAAIYGTVRLGGAAVRGAGALGGRLLSAGSVAGAPAAARGVASIGGRTGSALTRAYFGGARPAAGAVGGASRAAGGLFANAPSMAPSALGGVGLRAMLGPASIGMLAYGASGMERIDLGDPDSTELGLQLTELLGEEGLAAARRQVGGNLNLRQQQSLAASGDRRRWVQDIIAGVVSDVNPEGYDLPEAMRGMLEDWTAEGAKVGTNVMATIVDAVIGGMQNEIREENLRQKAIPFTAGADIPDPSAAGRGWQGIKPLTPVERWQERFDRLGGGNVLKLFGGRMGALQAATEQFMSDGRMSNAELEILQQIWHANERTANNTDPSAAMDRAAYLSPVDNADFQRIGV